METFKYVKPELTTIKALGYDEKWVQEKIASNPSIIGLGESAILKDKEKTQSHAGRLDLLLGDDEEEEKRYEVEIQLGGTDPEHIIRTIEYWDIERKRYPKYEHCAVIIAENITSRFFNVISLFNGAIPLIAIQMQIVKIGDSVSLVFTTVLDQRSLGQEYEETTETKDRKYWEETKGTKQTVEIVDEILKLIKNNISDSFELKYNQFYIGLSQQGKANNFVVFRPQRKKLRFEIRLPKSEEIENKIDQKFDMLDYHGGRYRIILTKESVEEKETFIIELLKSAYELS
ncbi:MAG: hypothetical protein LBT79_06900 [Elusimicrobiota bacterium]|jgi:hypothetical protein|nr:hypothetical protein [Elusimicrobiota bacterium]